MDGTPLVGIKHRFSYLSRASFFSDGNRTAENNKPWKNDYEDLSHQREGLRHIHAPGWLHTFYPSLSIYS